MAAAPDMSVKAESPDFSLALGGPLYQMYRRAHLSGPALELLHRRLLLIPLFAWLPLLLLSIIDGQSLGGHQIPFLRDIEAHVRFLISLPVLIAAEVVVHRRTVPIIRRFLERHIIRNEDLPRFHAAVDFALRARNSVAVEVALLVLVCTVGVWVWRSQVALGGASWYASPEGSNLHFTLAGHWYAFVSIPLFQFFLLRWYLRLFIWFWFLVRVSRLNLHLVSTHPDRAAGLGFLGTVSYAFGPILFAQGALLAGLIASRIFYNGQGLLSFKMQALGIVAFFVFFILGPLTIFTPQMMRAKREGGAEYGLLASQYVLAFEDKWVRASARNDEELLGIGDIQSLADLGNSYAVVREMRIVPFGLQDITRLAVATAAPLLPLMLTIIPLDELIGRLLKVIF